MRDAVRVRVTVFLALGAVLSAGHSLGADDGPALPTASPAPAAPTKRLKLGPYVDGYGVSPEQILDVPHFETRVEVQGRAMDSAALTAKMEWWMHDFQPLRGAVPQQGSAPSLQEIHEYRPHVTEGANILPVIDWLLDKINKKP
jgi:hypothetical protein